jgi:hypothetical protein
MGWDAEDARRFIGNIGLVRGRLKDLDDSRRAAALESLKETLAAHDQDGVVFLGGMVDQRASPRWLSGVRTNGY